jgi:long-subunit fatty acid transport protein
MGFTVIAELVDAPFEDNGGEGVAGREVAGGLGSASPWDRAQASVGWQLGTAYVPTQIRSRCSRAYRSMRPALRPGPRIRFARIS